LLQKSRGRIVTYRRIVRWRCIRVPYILHILQFLTEISHEYKFSRLLQCTGTIRSTLLQSGTET
jgi:hypothetical protein